MFTLQCTKKLESELGMMDFVPVPTAGDPLFGWHAHLFLLNRRKCVLVMNNETRYNFVLHGLKKQDFKRFHELVAESIAENLLADKADKQVIERYMQSADAFSFTKTSDRSIISQINDMILIIKHMHQYDMEEKGEIHDRWFYELNREINKVPMLKLPLAYSGETMLEALNNRQL
ncbi:hypothetical protein ABEW34_27205 [Paenibacillus algorifonticola]|uniref:DUF6933 domain-containing protein n=1 Tax=Paenibacillus algorifonticola TaxID=684063 RepID=UPI003D264D03